MSEQQLEALVVYESYFGNTERIARAVADGLRLEQVAATTIDVADVGSVDVDRFGLVVVGGPTHAFSLSRPSTREQAVARGGSDRDTASGLREWCSSVPSRNDGRLAASFDTRARKVKHLPASAARSAARLLRRRGFELMGRPTGFLVEDTEGPLAPQEMERAVTWGRSVARDAQARVAARTR